MPIMPNIPVAFDVCTSGILEVLLNLVLHPHDIDGFSAFLVFLSKAPYPGNGDSLVKYGNAAEGHEESAEPVNIMWMEYFG